MAVQDGMLKEMLMLKLIEELALMYSEIDDNSESNINYIVGIVYIVKELNYKLKTKLTMIMKSVLVNISNMELL